MTPANRSGLHESSIDGPRLFLESLLERIEVIIVGLGMIVTRVVVSGVVVSGVVVSGVVVSGVVMPLVIVLGVIVAGVVIMILPRGLTGGHGNGEEDDDKHGDQFHSSVIWFPILIAVQAPITNKIFCQSTRLSSGGNPLLTI